MWFNPAELVKLEIPRAAIPAIPATFQTEITESPEEIAKIAKIATAQKLETLTDRRREENRLKAIALMNASPDTPRGIYVDDQIDPDNIVLFVAVRSYMQTCELLIPRSKYDPFKLLELIERLNAKVNSQNQQRPGFAWHRELKRNTFSDNELLEV